MAYHLAQINIARLVAPLDDPKIAEFVALLEPINALADDASGFVWRLKSETGNATDIAYNDDPFVIVNVSVWESLDALAPTPTSPITQKCFATAPNGSRRWRSPATASGGFHSATSRALPRAASAWSTIRRMAPRRTPSGSLSTSPSPRTKVFASRPIFLSSFHKRKRPPEESAGRSHSCSRFQKNYRCLPL